MALDYGYTIRIQSNGSSDPSAVPTNQWQRKLRGSPTWTDLSGETGSTYTVNVADQSSQIRLKQDFNGSAAYSNVLSVTTSDPPVELPNPLTLVKTKESGSYYWSDVAYANGVWMICGGNYTTPGHPSQNETQRQTKEKGWFETVSGVGFASSLCYAGNNTWLVFGVDKKMYRSTNNGATFSEYSPSGLPISPSEQYYFFKNKSEGNTVLASSRYDPGIWRSTNSGASFTRVFSGKYFSFGYGRGNTWVGSNNITYTDRSIATSTNGGQSWTDRTSQIAQILGRPSDGVYSGWPYVDDKGHIYIWVKPTDLSSLSWVLKSTNGGSSWIKLNNSVNKWPTGRVGNVFGNGKGLVVIGARNTNDVTTWWTADDGANWKKAGYSPTNPGYNPSYCYDADFDDEKFMESTGSAGGNRAPIYTLML